MYIQKDLKQNQGCKGCNTKIFAFINQKTLLGLAIQIKPQSHKA